ncbi:GT2 family glycosyltransferase [Neorhizobium sp. 2083]|uniref:glycosyltransferase family 2 protein n=1 Tax=Neorhizobium sp. 2083 TaxID=2817762 RepID=UPI0028660A9B|nr:glycosyltransferase family 2 protein [Neorhizobium sp. 2083]MDR6818101.1 GT2 family glycosyltransferase [Neorhizobium sp. 2083]
MAHERIVILKRDDAHRYSKSPVLIEIHDPDLLLGSVVTIFFERDGRVPQTLSRQMLVDEHGRGSFFGWIPTGLIGIYVNSGPLEEGRTRRLQLRLRRVGLTEIALRTVLKSPHTMIEMLKLLVAGNRRGFRYRFARCFDRLNEPSYRQWLNTIPEFPKTRDLSLGSVSLPSVLISIVGDKEFAEVSRRSVAQQTYPFVREVSVEQLKDPEANDCLWVKLPSGILLHPQAIELMVQALLVHNGSVAVYCDEDLIGFRGRRCRPFFKPAWNPPLAETGWLAPDGALIRVQALAGEIDLEAADAGQLLLYTARRGQIAHLPRVLLHRIEPRSNVVASKPKTVKSKTNVTVVIPTRDRADLLRACLEGLFTRTRYDDLDVIVVDNESREGETLALFHHYEGSDRIRRIPLSGLFNFSRACNLGVAEARHELVLLLNNDIEPLEPGWLSQLVEELDDADVGAVGALLLYPDGYVQHGGVTLGTGSVARHNFSFVHPQAGEDSGLLSQRQEMSAVTAACLMTRRSMWNSVGGMDEDRLAVAFNDVDYCLKLREMGKRIMWTPHARLIHRESVSRGPDDTPEKIARFASEEAYMRKRWGDILESDPFYNPNLSLVTGDRSLGVYPRDLSPRLATLCPSSPKGADR